MSEAPAESGSASTAPDGETAEVRLEGFAFDPEELTVAAGAAVSFINADSAVHTVTEGTDGEAAEDPIIDDELDGNQATSSPSTNRARTRSPACSTRR